MVFKDYYKILGLETNRVSMDEIKIAYRNQAKKYHPDINIHNKKNEEIFKDINEAYDILSVQSTKRKYDRQWNRHVGREKNIYKRESDKKRSVKDQILYFCFGTIKDDSDMPKIVNSGVAKKGEDIQTEIAISIEDAFRGKEQMIAVRTVDGDLKKLKVDLPSGIQNNEKIRIIGQGKTGVNGAKNGDLLIKVKIKDDSKFKLEGYNLRTNLYLSPWEAALSTKITISGINEDVSVYIPKGIQSGDVIKIDNLGYKNGKGGRGDLLLDTRIMIPKHLSDKEQDLFDKLNKVSRFNPRSSEI